MTARTLGSTRLAMALLACVAPSCATLGSTGGGDVALPTSGVGPFRKLGVGEVLGVAPFVLDGSLARFREPSVLAVDPSDGASAGVFLFVVAATGAGSDTHDVIVRTRADDARSFFGTALDSGHAPAVVLFADAAWEGKDLAGPSALRIGGRFFLYYAAAGGVGLARSDDGLAFKKEPAPVLAPDASVAWETTAPRAPSVAVYPDGRIRMLYAAGHAIGEAESDDGVTWRRLDADPTTPAIDPVLSPAPPAAAGTLDDGERPPFDTAAVADPCLLPRTTSAGRVQVRVLYTGYDSPSGSADRPSAIGFAARYGAEGPLVRQSTAVFSVGKHEAAPALFEWNAGSILYVHQDHAGDTAPYAAISAALAPATAALPPPTAYASAP